MASLIRNTVRFSNQLRGGSKASLIYALPTSYVHSEDDSKVSKTLLAGESLIDLDLKMFGNVLGGEEPHADSKNTFIAWHLAVKELQPESLDKYLKTRVAPDVLFHPPTYFTHWKGNEELLLLLGSVGEVFGESFTYGRQWLSPDCREWALEFTATIEETGKSVQGIDLVSLDENGSIKDFKVLARPPNAVTLLKDAMMKKVPPRMALLKAKQAMSSVFGK